MAQSYIRYKELIKSILREENIHQLLKEPLSNIFKIEVQVRLKNTKNIDQFFDEYDKIDNTDKHKFLRKVLSGISGWLAALMSDDLTESLEAKRKFDIVFNLVETEVEQHIKCLKIDEVLLHECANEGIITEDNRGKLVADLNRIGETYAKYELIHLAILKDCEAYSKLLYCAYHRRHTDFIKNCHPDLYKCLDGKPDCDVRGIIRTYTENFINDNAKLNGSWDVPNLSLDETDLQCNSSVTAEDKDDCTQLIDDFNLMSVNDNDNVGSARLTEDGLVLEPFYTVEGTYDRENHRTNVVQLREYQNELVEYAISECNTIICSPTNSGKTLVAISIIKHFLKEHLEAKVAFLTPTASLCSQQHTEIKKHVKNSEIITGGPNSVPLEALFDHYNVFVMTPEILKRCLEDKQQAKISIGKFSLVIFDECHHCDKGDVYNRIMDFYFEEQENEKSVPHIVGLTASTGTDKAKNVKEAFEFLISLCANMDCWSLATVRTNIDDLQKYVFLPDKEIVICDSRKNDEFEKTLLEMFSDVEQILKSLMDQNEQKVDIPGDKFQDKYLNFLSGLCKKKWNLSKDSSSFLTVIAYYLEAFYRSLIINYLFGSSHAENYIERLQRNASTLPCEKELTALVQNFLAQKFVQDANLPLERLIDEICDQLCKDKDSRILVFVKEVLYSNILIKEVKRRKLTAIKCDVLVGTNKASARGGLTKSSTHDILNRFRNGDLNVLFCTSIGEEGLSISNCNLVIRYGHVTNETSMIQSRGRLRSQTSRYVVIIPEKFQWQEKKEVFNQFLESLMHKAIAKFQSESEENIKKLIANKRANRRIAPTATNPTVTLSGDSVHYKIFCRRCEFYLCDTRDIRISKTLYVVINRRMDSKILKVVVDSNNTTIECINCKNKLGYMRKVNQQSFPSPSIKEICFEKEPGKMSTFKIWTLVGITFPEFSLSEIIQ